MLVGDDDKPPMVFSLVDFVMEVQQTAAVIEEKLEEDSGPPDSGDDKVTEMKD